VACAAAHLILLHENGGIQQLGNKQVEPSKTKVNERVRIDHGISDVAGRAAGLGRSLASPRVMACCYYLFSAQNSALAAQFFDRLASGAGLTKHDPFTSYGAAAHQQRGKGQAAAPRNRALFFKAWIAYRSGKLVKCLRWNNGGANPEKFPEI